MWLQAKPEEDLEVLEILPASAIFPLYQCDQKIIENTVKKWRYLSHSGFVIARVPYYKWVLNLILFVAFFLII